ncbi:hypothetical protein EJ05DRAFT_473847 [Pseudovirgaria hyperparasitica]|uniref:Uncharacterized protein n=1 Tax=Pseudovirgaria hyperparasitica TaxID=470096 RepID=A0A6A6WGX2_9PEZI|nr:uncharacterized protein EJ05DRAFT_473847 [Pseudovirgaria hyperparasitica]KAF2761324.1 hypothetical protein EJ05DRAFT_473847 [Pseudovirgaria hyperparasitica]
MNSPQSSISFTDTPIPLDVPPAPLEDAPLAPSSSTNKPLPPRPPPSRTVSFADTDDEYIYSTQDNSYQTPQYVYIIYTLSIACSVASVGCFLVAMYIAHHIPFANEWTQQTDRYGELGVREMMILGGVNAAWTGFNLRMARQNTYFRLVVLNSMYDFLIWAALLAFAILVYLVELLDRDNMCWNSNVPRDRVGECEYFSEQILLPLDLTGAGLPMLVAVLHFILLIARCSLDIPEWWKGEGPYPYDDVGLQLQRMTTESGDSEEAQRLVPADEEDGSEDEQTQLPETDAQAEPHESRTSRDEEEGLIQL